MIDNLDGQISEMESSSDYTFIGIRPLKQIAITISDGPMKTGNQIDVAQVLQDAIIRSIYFVVMGISNIWGIEHD